MKSIKSILLTIGIVFVVYSSYFIAFVIPADNSGAKMEYLMESEVSEEELLDYLVSITDFKKDDFEVKINPNNNHISVKMPYIERPTMDVLSVKVEQAFVDRLLERGNLIYGPTSYNSSFHNFLIGHYIIFFVGVILIISYIVLKAREKKV